MFFFVNSINPEILSFEEKKLSLVYEKTMLLTLNGNLEHIARISKN